MTRLKSVPKKIDTTLESQYEQQANAQDNSFLLQAHNAIKNMDAQQAISLLKQTDMIKLFIYSDHDSAEKPALYAVKQRLGQGRIRFNQNQHCPYIVYALLLPLVEAPQFYFKYFSNEELKSLYEIMQLVKLKNLTQPRKTICEERLSELSKSIKTQKNEDKQTLIGSYHRLQIIKDVTDLWPDADKAFNAWFKSLESNNQNESASKTATQHKKSLDDLAPYEIAKLIRVSNNAINQKTLEDISYYLPGDAIVQKKSKVGRDKLYLKRDYLEQFETIFKRDYYKKAQRDQKTAKAEKPAKTIEQKPVQVETVQPAIVETKQDTVNLDVPSENIIKNLEKQVLALSNKEDEIYAKHKTEKNSEERAKLRDELGRTSEQRVDIEKDILELRETYAKLKFVYSKYNIANTVKDQIIHKTKTH